MAVTMGKNCAIHQEILGSEWRGPPVHRVPAPIPSYATDKDGFHYTMPETTAQTENTSCTVVIDEFYAKVKIDEIVKEIGPLDVHSVELVQEDGSVITKSNDRNDTLNKMLSSVDDIVKKYTGEDLRPAVEFEMQRRYKMIVKSHISKSSRASTKAKELAKTVSDINWEKNINSGMLEKMYVSQLDMYLQKLAGFTKAELQEKGFTKAKKAEAVKKHFYTTTQKKTSPSTPSPPQPPPPPSSSPPSPPSHTHPNTTVIPWGGQTMLQGRTVTLINTCPIDNSLKIFHLLFNESPRIKAYFNNSSEQVAQTLCRSLPLVGDGEFLRQNLSGSHLITLPFNKPLQASLMFGAMKRTCLLSI